ncbi:MAG: hypothetical protein SGPRY_003487 [Prymnesium sp.]
MRETFRLPSMSGWRGGADSLRRGEQPRFIVVHSAGDGMTRWSVALAETLSFAISNGLTMVEPCVRDGRIAPCELNELTEGEARLRAMQTKTDQLLGLRGMLRPLSAYKNTTDHIRALFPELPHMLMPYTEFTRQWDGGSLLARSHLLCAAYMSSSGCNRTYQEHVWSGHIVGNSKTQRQPESLLSRARGQPVLHLYYLRSGFFARNRTLMGRIFTGFSTFAPALYDVAETLPGSLGLSDGFYAYHWRSEKRCQNYAACADRLLATKRRIEAEHGLAPARSLLISDIPASGSSLWGGMSFGGHLRSTFLRSGAAQALERLLAANMTKLDVLPSMPGADLAVLSVLDLMLGARASHLVTCATLHAYCSKSCAWNGGFANTLRWLRHDRNMTFEW